MKICYKIFPIVQECWLPVHVDQNTCNGGFFINKALGLRRKANFVEAGHFRNYLLSRKSQLELRSRRDGGGGGGGGGSGNDPPQGRLSSPAIKSSDN